MYPLPSNPVPSTSNFIHRPTSAFKPISPASQHPAKAHHTPNNTAESSPGSSLPCGQPTPQHSNSTTGTPTQTTPSQQNAHSPPSTQPRKTSQYNHATQNQQPSHLNANINPSAKQFIPAASIPHVPSSPQQNIPKSTNGEGVKCSKHQDKPMNVSVSAATSLVI